MRHKISVILPIHNVEKELASTVQDCFETVGDVGADCEIIIIDDASTDNTKNIIDSEKDPRIVKINNTVREGNYKSRNKGMDICKGKYVCVMDADDISCFDRLEKQYCFMENNPQYTAVGTDIHFFSENSFPVPFQRLRDEREIKVRLLQDNVSMHPSLILRNDVLRKYNIRYNEEYYYAADYKLLVDISRVGDITNIPEFLLFYRKHPEQITSMNNDAQKMYRNRIQLKQLNDFKMRPSIDEIIVHHHLMNSLPLSKEQLDIAERWCNKLIFKNHKLQIYDEDCLYHFLEECFIKTIRKVQ